MNIRKFLSESIYYASIAIVVLLMLYCFLDVRSQKMSSPIALFRDSLVQAMYVKPFLEGETPFRISRLGAPFHHCAYMFPVGSALDYGMAAVCGFVMGDVFSGLNMAWMIKLALAGVIAAWSFRKLTISPVISYFLALVFALAPYAFLRNISHFNLSTYFVPYICYIVISLMQRKTLLCSKGTLCAFGVLCFFIGLGDLYVAFFSLFLVSIALFASCIRGWHPSHVLYSIATIICILGGSVLNSLPGMLALAANDEARSEFMVRRSRLSDANKHALRPVEMLLPPEHHPIPVYGNIRKEMGKLFPPSHETVPLGTTASIGFIVLLAGGLLACIGNHSQTIQTRIAKGTAIPFVLVVSLLLLSCHSGFFNIVVVFMPMVKVYGRVSIFIAFLSLLALGVALDAVVGRWRVGWFGRSSIPVYSLMIALATIALYDQGYPPSGSHKSYAELWAKSSDAYDELHQFVSNVEEQLPVGAMVYQLPAPFEDVERNYYYLSNLKPYVASTSLRWSFAPFAYVDDAQEWHERVGKLPIAELSAFLRQEGFAGIWLDMAFYESNKLRQANLDAILHNHGTGDLFYSEEKNYCFIKL